LSPSSRLAVSAQPWDVVQLIVRSALSCFFTPLFLHMASAHVTGPDLVFVVTSLAHIQVGIPLFPGFVSRSTERCMQVGLTLVCCPFAQHSELIRWVISFLRFCDFSCILIHLCRCCSAFPRPFVDIRTVSIRLNVSTFPRQSRTAALSQISPSFDHQFVARRSPLRSFYNCCCILFSPSPDVNGVFDMPSV